IHTPGHTEGSSVIMIGDILFTGDTLFYRECGRCDLAGGDYNDMLHSLKKLALLQGDYEVYPGHDKKSTLESERLNNPYIREAMN
ncbi:MAG: MBL fold metallo-hydrolase, partial [Clostridiales bacterium]|nr:MBL fold metallo-hydrolase [Clostridiales bacterium]